MRSGRTHPTKRGVATVASAALLLSLASGCAMQQKQTMQNLQRPGPINCSTAPGDLRVLRAEKANVAERMIEGVTAIYPAGAVMGILAGTETTKLKVAAGDYNAKIDARIAEITAACGAQ